MSGWDTTYNNALRLFNNAVGYDNLNAKTSNLRQALGAANMLPDDYNGKSQLISDIENYAYKCGIDL